MKKTGFLFKEICMWHDTGPCSVFAEPGGTIQPAPAAEHPETKRRLRNLVEVTGLLKQLTSLDADLATEEQILRCHSAEYIKRLEAGSKLGFGDGGDIAPYRKDSFEIANHSAGMVVQALRSVMTGEVDNAYTLNRPPGHHALYDQGAGFCLLANIPIGIRAMVAENLVTKVVVVDWDVHHGNGTQAAFYNDPNVLTISVHQADNYPVNSGAIDEIGEGEGKGANINIPLPPGSGIGAYMSVMERVIAPALKAFNPDVIVIASGYDACAMDPLGCMMLNSSSYGEMMGQVMAVADEVCDGKIVVVHEGGYSDGYVPFCGHSLINRLSGNFIDAHDTLDEEISNWGYQDLQPHQAAVIDDAAQLLKNIPSTSREHT